MKCVYHKDFDSTNIRYTNKYILKSVGKKMSTESLY